MKFLEVGNANSLDKQIFIKDLFKSISQNLQTFQLVGGLELLGSFKCVFNESCYWAVLSVSLMKVNVSVNFR